MWIYSASKGGFFNADKMADYEAAGTWPSDGVEVSDEVREALIGKAITADTNGFPVAAIESADQVRARYETAAQQLLDATAKAWGYDSVISAASYATSGVAQYKADANALIQWRDALWQAAYNVEVSVKNGQAMPATSEAFLAMLPPAPARPTA